MRCNVPARSLIEEGMLTLFYSPGACSLASHIALAESGLPYQAVRINTKNGDNCTPGYLRINRWGKVTALALEAGEVNTEGTAIMTPVADSVHDRVLLPAPGNRDGGKTMDGTDLLARHVHPAFRHMVRAGG